MKEMSFEKAVERLEEIVTTLEKGDCPLDKTVELYDEGLKLSQLCKTQLENAHQRVVTLEQFGEENGENE